MCGMFGGPWHFLTGHYSSLLAVWQTYNVPVDAPSPNADVIHSSVMYFIDASGRERYLASPMVHRTKAGSSYPPADQLAAWGWASRWWRAVSEDDEHIAAAE